MVTISLYKNHNIESYVCVWLREMNLVASVTHYLDVFSVGEIFPALVDSHNIVCDSVVDMFSLSGCAGRDVSTSVVATPLAAVVSERGVLVDATSTTVSFDKRMSLEVRKSSSASILSLRLRRFDSIHEFELSSPSNDFNDGDERNELLLELIGDAFKLCNKLKSSVVGEENKHQK